MSEARPLAGCIIIQNDGILALYNKENEHYELPGGKIEPGETPEAAAIRELEEELTVTVTIIRKLGEASFQQADTQRRYHWLLAEIPDGQEPSVGEPNKHSHYTYLSPQQLETEPLSPNMENVVYAIHEGSITLWGD